MPDLDDLLTPDVSRAASDAAGRPDVASLEARGVRRHRRRRAALAGAAVVAVVAVVGVTQVLGEAGSAPLDPAPSPSEPASTPQSEQERAEQVVDHPRARMTQIAVSPEDPDVRATVWRCGECDQTKSAIAVTTDGFETRHVLPKAGGELFPAGDGFVAKQNGEPTVVAGDGTVHPVEVDEGEPRPMQDGDVLVKAAGRWLGVDPEARTAYEVPMPDGGPFSEFEVVQQPGGRIDVLDLDQEADFTIVARVRWSGDGGATWQVTEQASDLPPGTSGGVGYHVLPSARDDIHAVAEVGEAFGDSYTPPGSPIESVARSGDGSSWTRYAMPVDHAAYWTPSLPVVLPDGRLVAWYEDWGGADQPDDFAHGFYIGEDWGNLEPVDMGAPFDDAGTFGCGPDACTEFVMHASVTEDRVVFYAADPGSGSTELYVTEDYGETWEQVDAR